MIFLVVSDQQMSPQTGPILSARIGERSCFRAHGRGLFLKPRSRVQTPLLNWPTCFRVFAQGSAKFGAVHGCVSFEGSKNGTLKLGVSKRNRSKKRPGSLPPINSRNLTGKRSLYKENGPNHPECQVPCELVGRYPLFGCGSQNRCPKRTP